MSKTVLITGGAGFIGAHLANELLSHGYHVRVLDALLPQVHGPGKRRPSYLNPDVELIVGDVRDPERVALALDHASAVFHFVALVGVGQSMYQLTNYTSTNCVGTASLLEAITDRRCVERLVVASSMSIYGEGAYRDSGGRLREAAERSAGQLKAGDWEVRSADGDILTPMPTPESKEARPASLYALSKYVQEKMCLNIGHAYGIEVAALRFFNAYGPNQALSNPYTGVLSNFASRVLNGKPPLIYEDGYQKRDFVSVYDVARACRLAMERKEAAGQVLNIGSGTPLTVRDVAARTVQAIGKPGVEPEITGNYRAGDIRHCFADITRAREMLGFKPLVSLEQGLLDLASWLQEQTAEDHAVEARAELAARGLMV